MYQQGDVYAFGIIMWEIFTSATPYAGMAHPQIMVRARPWAADCVGRRERQAVWGPMGPARADRSRAAMRPPASMAHPQVTVRRAGRSGLKPARAWCAQPGGVSRRHCHDF